MQLSQPTDIKPIVKENLTDTLPGIPVLIAAMGVIALVILAMIVGRSPVVVVPGFLIIVVMFFALMGLRTIAPNEARVLQLFGKYVETARDAVSVRLARGRDHQRQARG